MRWSQAFIPTLRNDPKDTEAISHKLALRSGLVRQLSSGVYTYLPLGTRVLQKITQIIREEMNRAGACELLMPALHPADLWKQTGRYESMGDEKLAFTNRSGFEFMLGPTHEEVCTSLVAHELKSFRDLPVNLYQIQTKFRDEARPRFGVIRTKEFVMKDAYSFDRDDAGLDENYQKMSKAYHEIFKRCGLTFQVVNADTGLMGGKMSQEFMVECPYGEDRVAKSKGGYIASIHIAGRKEVSLKAAKPQSKEPEAFDTPGLKTIADLSKLTKIPEAKLVKTMIYIADEKPIACLLTGDAEVNEAKLSRLVKAKTLRAASAKEIREVAGADPGSLGPVGLKLPIYADWDVSGLSDFVVGANEDDKHLKGVNLERDFKVAAFGDIRYVKAGDEAPDGSGKMELLTTMEVGHIFKLGTRYSEALGAEFLDEDGKRKPMIMGCYGIGVNRILAAAIEEHHDEKGIVWPASIAPFEYVLITVNQDHQETRETAESIYAQLKERGVEVLFDDRTERVGVKFKDSELIGIPKQIVVGERNLKNGNVELKDRKTGKSELIALDNLCEQIHG